MGFRVDPELRPPFEAALAFLAKRDRFVREVSMHLTSMGYDEGVADGVVKLLNEQKLLNDLKTTRSYLERNSGKRAVGLARIRAELEALGAPVDAIETSLAELGQTETERAIEVLRAQYRSLPSRAKAGRYLYGRGFDEDAVESALDQFLAS